MEMDGFASDTQLETADFVITIDFYLLETVIISFDNYQTYSFVEIARLDLRHLLVHIRKLPVSKGGRFTSYQVTLNEVSCGFTHLRQTNACIEQ
jgi:hypothetical protein